MTDVHANLPALTAALRAIQLEGYDLLVHLGDVVAIGPHPAECLEMLLSIPKTAFIMGNHDAWLVYGLPQPRPEWMSEGEVLHQQWTHAQISAELKAAVATWPYMWEQIFEGVSVTFVHYALDSNGRDFKPIVSQPSVVALDYLFAARDSELIFYGHHHPFVDTKGIAHYVNPGSLGCYNVALARYTVVEFAQGRYNLIHKVVAYDDETLRQAFVGRNVPEREFLWRAFFGGR